MTFPLDRKRFCTIVWSTAWARLQKRLQSI
jgi:hypothetical protein